MPAVFRILFMAILLTGASRIWAQSATTGALRGTVLDAEGAIVPGASVTVVNPTTGQTQTTTTDAKGLYGFSLLSPGTYDVDFAMAGFKTSRAAAVVVNVTEAPDLSAELESGESGERV